MKSQGLFSPGGGCAPPLSARGHFIDWRSRADALPSVWHTFSMHCLQKQCKVGRLFSLTFPVGFLCHGKGGMMACTAAGAWDSSCSYCSRPRRWVWDQNWDWVPTNSPSPSISTCQAHLLKTPWSKTNSTSQD